jgi:hypothetical protein
LRRAAAPTSVRDWAPPDAVTDAEITDPKPPLPLSCSVPCHASCRAVPACLGRHHTPPPCVAPCPATWPSPLPSVAATSPPSSVPSHLWRSSSRASKTQAHQTTTYQSSVCRRLCCSAMEPPPLSTSTPTMPTNASLHPHSSFPGHQTPSIAGHHAGTEAGAAMDAWHRRTSSSVASLPQPSTRMEP